jgi:adenylosuccinate synthase
MITVVMGGQYGSEGKGNFTNWFVRKGGFSIMRAGGPNAGHTMWHEGTEYKMRQLPVGWQVSNNLLYIAPEAVVDVDLLMREIEMTHIPKSRIIVSSSATVMLDSDAMEEAGDGTSANLPGRIGSTGKGIGAARSRRIWRTASTIGDLIENGGAKANRLQSMVTIREFYSGIRWFDTVIEGTQGFGLSLHHSGNYPYVTSSDLTPGHLLGACGISSKAPHQVVAVMRTYPIRVAGNSGTMHEEVSWQELGIRTDGYIKEERTTVTNKIRRVGEWDSALAHRMATVCQPSAIALMFIDYIDPSLSGATKPATIIDSRKAMDFIIMVEKETLAPVKWVGTGPDTIVRMRGRV